MLPRRSRAALLGLLLTWPAGPALAWTDATRVRMLRDALKVSPPALRDILEHYEKDLVRGMLDPSKHEDEEVHFQDASGKRGLGAAAVARKSTGIRQMMMEQKPLRRVAYEMGTLAHLVADVEFPLNASDADPREPLYREAFRSYVESQLAKFPFVFDRQSETALKKGNLQAFMMASARRAARNYPHVGPAYKDDGTPVSRDALDERSVPFGVASLSYSHATSNIALVWRHLWQSVNGDLEGTPYLGAPPPEKVTLPPRPPRKTRREARTPPPSSAASPAPGKSPATRATPRPTPTLTPTPTPTPPAAPAESPRSR
jgi:hypothetical protein